MSNFGEDLRKACATIAENQSKIYENGTSKGYSDGFNDGFDALISEVSEMATIRLLHSNQ